MKLKVTIEMTGYDGKVTKTATNELSVAEISGPIPDRENFLGRADDIVRAIADTQLRELYDVTVAEIERAVDEDKIREEKRKLKEAEEEAKAKEEAERTRMLQNSAASDDNETLPTKGARK